MFNRKRQGSVKGTGDMGTQTFNGNRMTLRPRTLLPHQRCTNVAASLLSFHPHPRYINLRRQAAGFVVVATIALAPLQTMATPLDEPFVGGVGFGGPTTGDLTSVYWNPAALSMISGTEFHMSGLLRVANTKVQRPQVNSTTGLPDPALPQQTLNGGGTLWPKPWSPGPGWFAGIGANVMGRFTLAVAAYMPSYERLRYQPTASEQAAIGFHGLDMDLRNFALVPALAVRMGKFLHVGLAPGFLFAGGTMTFDEDTAINRGTPGLTADCGGMPCGYENPAAIARYRLNAGTEPFSTVPAFTLGGGIHYKRDSWSVGVAYASRALGNDGAGVRLDIQEGGITRAPNSALPSPLCPSTPPLPPSPTYNAACINGQLSYRLPDAVMVGVTWDKSERWSFTGIVRYQTFSQHDRMVLTLAGPSGSELGQNGLRSRLVLDRGFQDRVDVRARAVRSWNKVARAGVGMRVATSAVPLKQLTPMAVDGLTFEPFVMAEVKLKLLTIRAGYAFGFMARRKVDNSAFSSQAAVNCVDANYNLDNSNCVDLREGRARPTAAGTYSHLRHTLSLNLLARF